MAENRKIIKVFLGSPGDLVEERQAAKSVVEELNSIFAESHGYQIDLIGWENTVSNYGRPQEVINRELNRCDVFVGMMWRRWGTPPDNEGRFTSGFEEEFVTSESRLAATGSPEMSLFFKEVSPEILRDPGEDLRKVQAFKQGIINKKTILFQSFVDTREFEGRFRRCISSYLIKLWNAERNLVTSQSQAPIDDATSESGERANSGDSDTAFSESGIRFLKGFVNSVQTTSDLDKLKPFEVARFRLLSIVVRKVGNDDAYLGVHDCNLLYVNAKGIDFDQREVRALLKSGLEHYPHEIAPVWAWVNALQGFTEPILPELAFSDVSDDVRVGALKAMRQIAEPIPTNDVIDRSKFLAEWLKPKSTTQLKAAALEYLAEYGEVDDINLITAEFKRNDYRTSDAALNANIRINLRVSQENAIRALYELQPSSVSEKLLDEIFGENSSAGDNVLLEGLDHANSVVRRYIVTLLCKRNKLPADKAELLLLDEDAHTRLQAILFLKDSGREFSKAKAKEILVKNVSPKSAGLLASAMIQPNGEEQFATFEAEGLRSLDRKTLDELADADALFDRHPWFIRVERNFKARGPELRSAIDDRFANHFLDQLNKLSTRFGPNNDLIDKVKSVEKRMRDRMMALGMEVLYKAKDVADISRVRDALRDSELPWSPEAVAFMQKLGRFDDIPLLVDASKRGSNLRGMLTIDATSAERTAVTAKAILKLGKGKLERVLALDMPAKLLCEVLRNVSDVVFQQFSDATIVKFLRTDTESVRKTISLKCISSLSKERLVELLRQVLTGDEVYFYNVVHWLDFGISCPKPRAVAAAKRQLQFESS